MSATPSTPERPSQSSAAGPPGRADGSLRLHDGTPVWLRPGAEEDPQTGGPAELVARAADGRTVGRAAYRRVYGPRAELSIEVDDAFWHRDLPAVLIASLREHAAAAGISTLLVNVSASDVRLVALLCQDFAARARRDDARVDVELPCADASRLVLASLRHLAPRPLSVAFGR